MVKGMGFSTMLNKILKLELLFASMIAGWIIITVFAVATAGQRLIAREVEPPKSAAVVVVRLPWAQYKHAVVQVNPKDAYRTLGER